MHVSARSHATPRCFQSYTLKVSEMMSCMGRKQSVNDMVKEYSYMLLILHVDLAFAIYIQYIIFILYSYVYMYVHSYIV